MFLQVSKRPVRNFRRCEKWDLLHWVSNYAASKSFEVVLEIIQQTIFREECSSLGGTNGGTCASGFGVCCIGKYLYTIIKHGVTEHFFSVTLTCGDSSNQNCSYFEVSNPAPGQCRAQICKLNPGICSIRLDFTSFTITGPTTLTTTSVELLSKKKNQRRWQLYWLIMSF